MCHGDCYLENLEYIKIVNFIDTKIMRITKKFLIFYGNFIDSEQMISEHLKITNSFFFNYTHLLIYMLF